MNRLILALLALPLLASGCMGASSEDAAPPASTEMAEYAALESEEAPARDESSPAATTASRQVIRTYHLQLRADSPSDVLRAARGLALDRGGFVDSSSAGGAGSSTSSVRATFRVPAASLDTLIAELRGLGSVLGEAEEGEDVTEQLVDLGARLGAKRELETRLIDLAARSGSVDDLLRVEQELARVRGEVEVMQARQRSLEERVALSTIHLVVEAPVQHIAFAAQSFGSRLENAWAHGLGEAGDFIVGTVGVVTALSPLLVFVALFALALRAIRRRRRTLLATTPA